MTRYFDDFSSYTTGARADGTNGGLPGWTPRWWFADAPSVPRIVDDTSATGGKALHFAAYTSSRMAGGLSYNAVDGANELELVTRFKTSRTSFVPMLFSHGAGLLYGQNYVEQAYSAEPYRLTTSTYRFNIMKHNNASPARMGNDFTHTIEPGVWWWMRYRRTADGWYYVRLWQDGTPEPTTWTTQSNATDTAFLGGWVGLGMREQPDDYYYDIFGVGTNGDAAPTSEVSFPVSNPVFRDGSWWEKPLPDPASTPVHANNAAYLQSLQDVVTARPENTVGVYNNLAYCAMVGADDPGPHPSNDWSWPIYRVSDTDTRYVVVNAGTYTLPKEIVEAPGIRIPEIAKDYYDSTLTIATDREFVIDDPVAGYAVLLNRAAWNASLGQWEAVGAQIAYYKSYGMDPRGDDSTSVWPTELHYYVDEARNSGTFRGANPRGRVVPAKDAFDPKVTSLTVWQPGPDHVFPYVDGEAGKTGIIPEGTRLRLRDINYRTHLAADGLTGAALDQAVRLCELLRDYGVIVADTSGSGSYIHMENKRRKGEAHYWQFGNTALRTLPFTDTYWQFVADNYDPAPVIKPEPPSKKTTSLEAGTNGAKIDPAYSGSSVDDALDSAYASTNNTVTYSNAYAYQGTLSAAFNSTGGGSASWIQYSLPSSDSTSRIFLYVPAAQSAVIRLAEWYDSANAVKVGLDLNTNGTLALKGPGGTSLGTTATAITFGAWVRIELRSISESVAAAADGTIELRLYNTPTAAIDSPTATISATGQANGTELSYHRTGIVYRPGVGPIYIDGFSVSKLGWIGPRTYLPPAAPTLLDPADGGSIVDNGSEFTWKHNSQEGVAQSRVHMRRRAVGATEYEYLTIGFNSLTGESWFTFSTGADSGVDRTAEVITFDSRANWVAGTTYEWSVATEEETGEIGAYAVDRQVSVTSSVVEVTGTASCAATSAVSINSRAITYGTSTHAATASAGATGRGTSASAVSSSAASDLTTIGNVLSNGKVTMSATASSTATGFIEVVIHTAAVVSESSTALTASGNAASVSGVAINATASLTSVGGTTSDNQIVMSATASFISAGSVTSTGQAAMNATTSFASVSGTTSTNRIVMNAAASFTSAGSAASTGQTAMSATASTAAFGTVVSVGPATHTASILMQSSASTTVVFGGTSFSIISIGASASLSTTMSTTRISITDSSKPAVLGENYATGMFDWVVEPAGSGTYNTISLL